MVLTFWTVIIWLFDLLTFCSASKLKHITVESYVPTATNTSLKCDILGAHAHAPKYPPGGVVTTVLVTWIYAAPAPRAVIGSAPNMQYFYSSWKEAVDYWVVLKRLAFFQRLYSWESRIYRDRIYICKPRRAVWPPNPTSQVCCFRIYGSRGSLTLEMLCAVYNVHCKLQLGPRTVY